MKQRGFPAYAAAGLVGMLVLGLTAGCSGGPHAASTPPIAPSKMQDYNQMMRSGGLHPAGTATPSASRPGMAPMMPGSPGSAPGTAPMMPGAPGTAPRGTTP